MQIPYPYQNFYCFRLYYHTYIYFIILNNKVAFGLDAGSRDYVVSVKNPRLIPISH